MARSRRPLGREAGPASAGSGAQIDARRSAAPGPRAVDRRGSMVPGPPRGGGVGCEGTTLKAAPLHQERISTMEHQRLGTTGLVVSRICLGCMSYGDPDASLPGQPYWKWA